MLFYIERCHAAAEASAGRGAERSGGDIAPGGDAGTGTAAAASNAARAAQADSPPVPPLGAEETCWLLELLAALACAACVPAGGAIYVPRSGADMLLTLPFVSRKSGTGVLAAYAARLAAVEKEAPGRLYELWRRLACALAVAVRSLAAAAGAGGGGSSPSTPSLQAARALLGRLALACGAFLSALAARYPGGADLPAEVPGALYTGLQAAAEVAPSLGAPLTGLCKAQQVSQLVTCLQSVAAGLDTALMQVGGQVGGGARSSQGQLEVCVRTAAGWHLAAAAWRSPVPSPSPWCSSDNMPLVPTTGHCARGMRVRWLP